MKSHKNKEKVKVTIMNFDKIIRLPEEELFNELVTKYETPYFVDGDFILVKGNAPILLISHLDTVHQEPVKTICRSDDGNILMSPEGIGGDDRCGVYALTTIYKNAKVKPWLLFTCGEEIGGIGAASFTDYYNDNILPEEMKQIKLIVEIDRKGKNDAVYYDCDNPEFEKYITSKGFETQFGSFSDISIIAPTMKVAAVNLSSGYYNAHTQHEYIKIDEIHETISKVMEMVEDSLKEDFPVYEFIEKKYPYVVKYGNGKEYNFTNANYGMSRYGMNAYGMQYADGYDDEEWGVAPDDLTEDRQEKYECLLDIYSPTLLDQYRKEMGDEIIDQLFEEEFGDADFLPQVYDSETVAH